MEIREEKKGDTTILALNGHMDISKSVLLEKRVQAVFEQGAKNLIMDLADLHYISSSGLRILLLASQQSQKRGGKLLLCSLQDTIARVFEISEFDTLFPILPTLDEALDELEAE